MNKSYHIKGCNYTKDEIINSDCPKCLEIWNKFITKNNLYVTGEGT